jgi:hypothetical protein
VTPLDALYRAQRAWEQSQPQLFFELWPDSGLDETHVPARPCALGVEAAVRLVEPAPAYRLTAEARADSQLAPNRDAWGLTAVRPTGCPRLSHPPRGQAGRRHPLIRPPPTAHPPQRGRRVGGRR